MEFPLHPLSFSRAGSYIAFTQVGTDRPVPPGLYWRSLYGELNIVNAMSCMGGFIARLQTVFAGQDVPFEATATPALLTLSAPQGHVEICIAENHTLRMRGMGVGLRLEFQTPPPQWNSAFQLSPNRWQIACPSMRSQWMLNLLSGSVAVDCPWNGFGAERVNVTLGADSPTWEAQFDEFTTSYQPVASPPFESCLHAVEDDFAAFCSALPQVDARWEAANETAAYIQWSALVHPRGHLTRPAMLMSINAMTSVWSWDHCFNAMALIESHPQLAWDQFLLFFDVQDEHGCLPDSVNDDILIRAFTKPPIHGWALAWMLRRTDWIDAPKLAQVYQPLCKWTDWWLNFRDDDRDGIPQYNHGNDSGWDNGTPFRIGVPLESPDLSAYLVLQMEMLAEIARCLGQETAAIQWQRRSEKLLADMLAHFWRGDHFIAMRSGDHATHETESLFLYLPLVLGKRLPADVRAALLKGLTMPGRFITPHGLASESLLSPLYEPDGYWRGGIWGASTLIILDGLQQIGETALAADLAEKFCDLCAASGMAENFDAITGESRRDPAYTWTSSIFQIFARGITKK